MVAGGDEQLLALDFAIALIRRGRRGGEVGERRARLRFGERHRALPFARDHFGQIRILHFLSAVGSDQARRAVRQTVVNGGGIVGRTENRRRQHHADGERKLLAAQIVGKGGGDPAAVTRRAHDLADPGMHPDFAVDILGGLAVHFLKQGFEEVLAHPHRGVQNHVEDFPAVIGKAGIFQKGFHVVDFVKKESQVPVADKFFCHPALLCLLEKRKARKERASRFCEKSPEPFSPGDVVAPARGSSRRKTA